MQQDFDMQHTAIFDIGKTNKKFFVFDEAFQVVFQESIQIEEIEDEDGFPTDDLSAILHWMETVFSNVLSSTSFNITQLNFSTYGATMVHVDAMGKVLTPLYNYLKPYPEDVLEHFYKKYGLVERIAQETASPPSGMLNTGFQLYWLKYKRPEIFQQIKWSFHFPQYLPLLFTGIPVSEYTSLGCHTSLWNYEKKDYHDWVFEEQLDQQLPPIAETTTSHLVNYKGHEIKIGIGIHDSSAALLPYIQADENPFLLLSTGTWNIALNPFNQELLSADDLQNDCLNYMRVDGKAVKAARLFLGNEHQLQLKYLCRFFKKEKFYHQQIKLDTVILNKIKNEKARLFQLESIGLDEGNPKEANWQVFETFEEAYHRLMWELMQFQFSKINKVIGQVDLKKIYIDGGFSENDLFIKILGQEYPSYEIQIAQSPIGSALGAAIIISRSKNP